MEAGFLRIAFWRLVAGRSRGGGDGKRPVKEDRVAAATLARG
jgi:hypothetical protein